MCKRSTEQPWLPCSHRRVRQGVHRRKIHQRFKDWLLLVDPTHLDDPGRVDRAILALSALDPVNQRIKAVVKLFQQYAMNKDQSDLKVEQEENQKELSDLRKGMQQQVSSLFQQYQQQQTMQAGMF